MPIACKWHCTSRGLASLASGGSFWQGFASGAVASFFSSGTECLCVVKEISKGWTKAAIVAAGTLSGGVTATMAGGDFWEGVCNSLICSGLNHALHLAVGSDDPPGSRIKWLLRFQKNIRVPKQIGHMDCKYAIMEGVAESYGETMMTQRDFRIMGQKFIDKNPTIRLSDLFELCGFSVSYDDKLYQSTLNQMSQNGIPIAVRYAPDTESDHLGLMTAFGVNSEGEHVIQLRDPFYGNGHVILRSCVTGYYQITGYKTIQTILNEPIKCLHFY